jgi:hypothetical protein
MPLEAVTAVDTWIALVAAIAPWATAAAADLHLVAAAAAQTEVAADMQRKLFLLRCSCLDKLLTISSASVRRVL